MFRNVLRLLILFAFIHGTLILNAYAEDGVVSAITDDNIELKIRHYRPSANDSFHTGGQPVLLFPGILCNANQFLIHTPDQRKKAYQGMTLPQPLADWADGDPVIQADPMLYYNICYYLYTQGYDPWVANYRGVGRGDMESRKGFNNANLDVWTALDVDACVRQVRALTGMQVVIGGHSTGGRVVYEYLQGVTIDVSKMTGKVVPHVVADPGIAAARNRAVKGLLLLDPGSIPPLPVIIDQYSIWKATGSSLYFDFDGLMENVVNPYLTSKNIMTVSVETIFGTIDTLADMYAGIPGYLYSEELDIFRYLNVWLVKNTDANVEDYFARYCVGSTYMRGLTEFGDNSLNNANREHWKNGEENTDIVAGPAPDRGNDGYYYYDDPVNMSRVTAPAIAIFSDEGALVDYKEVIATVFNQKTKHPLDTWIVVEDTAHLDVVAGYKTPTVAFPAIGKWLASLESDNDNSSNVSEDIISDDSSSADSTSGNYPVYGGVSGCGSSATAAGHGKVAASDSSGLELVIITAMICLAGYIKRRRYSM